MNDRARFNQIETANIWTVEEPPPFPDWMEEYFVLTEESSATSGNWRNRPAQRGMCYAMANLNIPVYMEMGPAQQGKSKRVVGYYGYDVRERRRNLVLYQPTDDDALDFSVTQIDGMLTSCSRVAEAMLVSPDERHKHNTNARKRFQGATAYCRGAQNDTNFRRITADTAIVDDWDGCPRIVRGSGNKNMGTVRGRSKGRTQASVQPKQLLVTTPGKKGDSLIEEGLAACPVVMIRETPCPHCGTHQELILNTTRHETSYGLIYDTLATDQESALTARYRCRDCGEDFSWGQMRHQEKTGRWRCRKTGIIQFDIPGDPRDGHYYDPAVCTETMIEDPVEIAYCWSALISDDIPWSNIIGQYLGALRLMAAGDSSALVGFYNEVLAQLYEPPEAEAFTNDELCTRLTKHNRLYDAEAPWGTQRIALVVDVQKHWFDYEYVAVGYGLQTWGLCTGEIYGQCWDRTHKCWTELAELEKRVFVNQHGDPIPVATTFIDAQNRPDDVLSWCEKRPKHRIGIRGQARLDHPICLLKPPPRTKRPGTYRCYQINMGAQKCSEKLYAMLGIELPEQWQPGDSVPGLMSFPDIPGYREINEDTGEITSRYFDQLIAEQLVEKVRGGRVVHVYECPEGVRNEKHDLRKIILAGVEAWLRLGYRFKKPEFLTPYIEPSSEQKDKPKASTSKANKFAQMAKGFAR